jgi:hypothetical protein
MANKFTDAVFNAQLSGMIKVVLYTLAMRADNDTGVCWTSHKRLASDSGVSVSSAQRAVEYSINHKIIRISGQRPSRSGPINEYTMNLETLESLVRETTLVTETSLEPIQTDKPSQRDYPSLVREGIEPSLSDLQNSKENSKENSSCKLASSHESVSKPTNPDTLDDAEKKMYDWAKEHNFWNKFTPSMKGFRKGCLESDNFRKQYQAAMKKSKKNPAYHTGTEAQLASEVPSSLMSEEIRRQRIEEGLAKHRKGLPALKPRPQIMPDPGDDIEEIARWNAELDAEDPL